MKSETLLRSEIQSGISLALVYVFRMLGLFMVIPVLAVAALDYPDYSALWVGLAVGGYGLTQAILQIPMGMLSDKYGRKQIIYLGLALFAIGSFIAGMADSMLMLTIGRVMQGSGAIAGAVLALASDATRESQRTKIMAIIGIAIGFSFYLALFLGPFIVSKIGLNGIFLFTAALAMVCLPLVKFGVVVSPDTFASAEAVPQRGALKQLFKHPILWRLNVSVLVIHLLITSFFVQVPVLLTNIDVPLSEHWQVYGIVLLLSVIGLGALMQVSKKVALNLSLRLALLLMAVGFVLLASQAEHYWMLVIAGIVFFSGFNFVEAKMPALVSSVCPAGRKGSAMGIYASFQFFGAFLGGLLAGVLNTYFDASYTFVLCLVLLFMLNLLARGIANVEQVQRINLPFNKQNFTAPEQLSVICERISALAGVKEAVVDHDAGIMYLKVNKQQFQLAQAQELVS